MLYREWGREGKTVGSVLKTMWMMWKRKDFWENAFRRRYQWYEKEQYYGIQVKIQKEILYPDQNLEKEKQKEIE